MSGFAVLADLNDADDAIEEHEKELAGRNPAEAEEDSRRVARCTQHTILVIDASASMRECDVVQGKRKVTRMEALLDAVRTVFLKPQLEAGVGKDELLSVIRLQDDAGMILELAAFEDVELPALHPRSHGNYIPALKRIIYLMREVGSCRDRHGWPSERKCCTNVLFLSDGRPSDSNIHGPNGALPAITEVACNMVSRMWRSVGEDADSFKLLTVGFGNEDFSVLRAMANTLPPKVGVFREVTLDQEVLFDTIATFSETVTSSRLTSTAGGPRQLRPVDRMGSQDDAHAQAVVYTAYNSEVYKVADEWGAKVLKGQLSKKRRGQLKGPMAQEVIAVSKQSFASGGERNVFFLRLGKRRSRVTGGLLADVGDGTPFAIEGEEVVIHGLLGASSSVLNGCTGELISRVVSNGRFRVRIADTSGSTAAADARHGIVAVMPGNLRFITTGAAGLYCDYSWSCCWVAKENKRIEDTVQKEVEFHEKSLLTQATAAAMARGFNDLVKSRRLPFNTPRVTYLEKCYFIQAKPWSITMQGDEATRLFFVEEYLDGKYHKWNTNFGTISRKPTQPAGNSFAAQPPALAKKQHPNTLGLGGIIEEDEEEDGDDFDDFDGLTLESNRSSAVGFVPVGEQPTVDNVPQAFTHWTHVKKMQNGSIMVCDVQGTFSPEQNCFHWSDPVVHSDLAGQTKTNFGRTDRGETGILDFFKTHKCNPLCRLLSLPPNLRYDPNAAAKATSEQSTIGSSRNTSEYTVHQTDHLKQRKQERNVTTRELQAARKHGAKSTTTGGNIAHDHSGLRYVTDETGKVGVTSFHRGPHPSFETEKYKTQLCARFSRGNCEYGSNCWFAHGHHALQR